MALCGRVVSRWLAGWVGSRWGLLLHGEGALRTQSKAAWQVPTHSHPRHSSFSLRTDPGGGAAVV